MSTQHLQRKALVTIAVVAVCLAIPGLRPADAQSMVSSYNIYYGHLHNHCNLSDGTGTPTTAYSTAKASGMDFFSLSDHSNALSTASYQTMIDAANAANQDNVFTAFYGFEWSSSNYGHVTVINSPVFCTTTSQPDFDALLTWLSSHEGIAFCNHPGRQNGTGQEFDHFTDWPSGAIKGMELWNKSTGFTTYYYNNGYTSDSRTRSGYFDDALFNGWRLGAAGAEDNHVGTWGSGSYRLAVLAGSNTRASIYSALEEKRFYSTLDKNLELSFTVNGYQMGSSIMGGTCQYVVRAADRDGETFSKVEIIHNGYVVSTQDVSSQTNPEVTYGLTAQQGDYIYCKVTESDGGEAISSPVFISSNGPDGPPRGDLLVPLDNGPADFDSAADQVTVNTTQANFQIQLTDLDGVNDGSVTAATVSIAGLDSGSDYSFSYDAGTDIITLAPLGGPVFGNGVYTITVNGISDLAGEVMSAIILTVRVDTSIVAPQTVRFQQGLTGYSSTADTMLCAGAATTSFATTDSLNVDTSDLYGGVSQALFRFGSIIGSGAGQIPPGANISSATLRLRSLDTGNGGHFHVMLQPWSDSSTWNALVNGVTADNTEAASAIDASVSSTSIGDVDLNVTGTVQSWANGTTNNGWVVLPNGTDGSHFASAEHATADYRPELIVTFTPGGNVPPVANAGPDQTVADDDGNGTEIVTLNGSQSYHPDPDGYITGYQWTWSVNGTQYETTGVTPNISLPVGSRVVTLTVTDNMSQTNTDTATVTVNANQAPTARGGADQAVVDTDNDGFATLTLDGSASTDADGTIALYEWTVNSQLVSDPEGDGVVTVTLPLGNHTAQLEVVDNGGLSATDTVAITITGTAVNRPPNAVADSAATNEDVPTTINVLANDSDLDPDVLTVTAVTQPAHGSATVNANSTVTYSPAANYSGGDSFTYTVSDGQGGTDTATVNITVNPVNDNPVARDDTATTQQDAPVTVLVLNNDSDVDGDSLAVTAVGTPTHGTVTNGGSSVLYTPNPGYTGTDSFTYTIGDGHGGTATALVSVTVTPSVPTPTVSVQSITMSVIAGKKYKATALVVLDPSLQDATVVGDWYFKGILRTSGATATFSNGGYLFTSPEVPAKPGNQFMFRVTDVLHNTNQFVPNPAKDSATIAVGQ